MSNDNQDSRHSSVYAECCQAQGYEHDLHSYELNFNTTTEALLLVASILMLLQLFEVFIQRPLMRWYRFGT